MKCPHCGKEIEIEDNRGEKQKLGMTKKASKGNHVSRTPFGYEWKQKNFIMYDLIIEGNDVNGRMSPNKKMVVPDAIILEISEMQILMQYYLSYMKWN